MDERGGPTTHAGIRYQNGVAALYLGELVDWETADPRTRVVEVRVEAPADVDDLVVRFADGHRDWAQVKLSLASSGGAWDRLWRDFDAQLRDPAFGPNDRLLLILGSSEAIATDLAAMAMRAKHGDEQEWRERRLTKRQSKLAFLIDAQTDGRTHPLFRALTVEIIDDDRLERDFAPHRLPTSHVGPQRLLAYLRDLAGGDARVRAFFTASQLRQRLLDLHGLVLEPPARWGLPAYLDSVRALARIAVPGTNEGGDCDDLFLWPTAQASDSARSHIEDEFGWRRRPTPDETLDFRLFPTPDQKPLIVHAGPGFGKSTLLAAIARRLSSSSSVPAVVPLAALAPAKVDVLSFLTDELNRDFRVQVDWPVLCDEGTAVVLFDGLDEAAPGERAAIVKKLELFTARFPKVAWLMTVRDPAVIPAGLDAAKYELMPLSDEELKWFVTAWRPRWSEAKVERFFDRIKAHPDINTMVRVPLFLSLLITVWDDESAPPSGRSDLLEAYLKTLFRPEEHKKTERGADPERLRSAAEKLAFDLLRQGEIGARERQVRALMGELASPRVSADQLYDDAIRCGLLRKQSATRLIFPFPIVQEYLAACWVLENHHDQVGAMAKRAIERPWAQVIQFALENLEDATPVALQLLDEPDDAFAHTARLLGRCILNGMHCEDAVVAEVGRRLTAAWPRVSYWTSQRIGQMLKDGWTAPLLPELRIAVHGRYLLHDGAGDILVTLANPELTLSVLRSRLAEKDILPNLGPMQPAIDAIAQQAFDEYVQAAERFRDKVPELWSIASLIEKLDTSTLEPTSVQDIVNDPKRPTILRLACLRLMEQVPPDDLWGIVFKLLKSTDYHERWIGRDALFCWPDSDQRLIGILMDEGVPLKMRERLVDDLRSTIPEADRRIDFIRTNKDDARLPKSIREKLCIWGATMGLADLFNELVAMIPRMSAEHVSFVVDLLSEYRSRENGRRLVEALRARTFTPKGRARVAHALSISVRYKSERYSLGSAALHPVPPHPAYDLVLSLIEDWWAMDDCDQLRRLEITSIAAEMGIEGAVPALHKLALQIIGEGQVGNHGSPLNMPIRQAVTVLQERGSPLPFEALKRLAETSQSNARMGALYAMGSLATREALDYLLDDYHNNPEDRSVKLHAIEEAASRLDLRIDRRSGGLSIRGQSPSFEHGHACLC
jgi:hypothetical protein